MSILKIKHEELRKIIKEEMEYQLKSIETVKRNDIQVLLKNYQKYINDIDTLKREIEELKAGKPLETGRVLSEINVQSSPVFKSVLEKKEDRIENLNSNIENLSYIIKKIDNALNIISNNDYYELIELKYFQKKTVNEIMDILHISYGTYKKHHARLINEIKSVIFI